MLFAPNMIKTQKLKTSLCKRNTENKNQIQTNPLKYHFAPRDDDVRVGHPTLIPPCTTRSGILSCPRPTSLLQAKLNWQTCEMLHGNSKSEH